MKRRVLSALHGAVFQVDAAAQALNVRHQALMGGRAELDIPKPLMHRSAGWREQHQPLLHR